MNILISIQLVEQPNCNDTTVSQKSTKMQNSFLVPTHPVINRKNGHKLVSSNKEVWYANYHYIPFL